MSVDLSQFHQVFFEESFEGLDAMESNLLDLSPDSLDVEVINTIFRAAHSIKGGAGTFGFMQVSEFTHVVETLLDEIRSGQRQITSEHIELFLQSVDCLRSILEQLQDGNEADLSDADTLKVKFEAILAGEDVEEVSASEAVNNEQEENSTTNAGGWIISFKPALDILCTGNEPYRMFRELMELSPEGATTIVAHQENLPDFSTMNADQCYLHWTITINHPLEQSDIAEVFEWVEDECEITYQKLDSSASNESLSDAEIPSDEENQIQVDDTAEIQVEESAQEPIEEIKEASQEISPELQEAETTQPQDQDETKKPEAAKPVVNKTTKNSENSSIRVSTDKVDSLINMVGELVITQSMLGQIGQLGSAGQMLGANDLQRLQEGLDQLEQNTRELQESVMKIRMMPISFAFNRFPRLVRDLSRQLGKKVDLVILGETTELDKTVMEKIGDPLVHLVRNSMDHGLELPENRIENGKSETGTVTLNAYHHGSNIVIEITDDGAGLNSEKILQKAIENGLVKKGETISPDQINDLIFQPGFSTADVVSDVSGRGVGMDVVRRNIAELNGSIEVMSMSGQGSTFTIRLPLTLAILDGQLVKVKEETYILPLISIVESIQIGKAELNHVGGRQHVLKLRDEYIPVVKLQELFNENPSSEMELSEDSMMVVVEIDNEKIGLVVDELLGQQQVVIKSLEQNYRKVESISGATILGNGTVALIVDISGIQKAMAEKNNTQAA